MDALDRSYRRRGARCIRLRYDIKTGHKHAGRDADAGPNAHRDGSAHTHAGGRDRWPGPELGARRWHRRILRRCRRVWGWSGRGLLVSRKELRELKSLSAEQRAQLLAWIETYAPYEFDHRDPAVADSMRVRLTFAGRGGQEISDAERRAMLAWVGALVPPRSSEAFPPQVVESATSRPAPAGLVYRAEEALWSVDANGQQRTLTRYGDALPAPDLARALHWDGEALWVIRPPYGNARADRDRSACRAGRRVLFSGPTQIPSCWACSRVRQKRGRAWDIWPCSISRVAS